MIKTHRLITRGSSIRMMRNKDEEYMQWDKLRRPQLDNLDRSIPLIVSVAAVEQHGKHLALSTDVIIVKAVARKLDQSMQWSIK